MKNKREDGYVLAYVLIVIMILTLVVGNIYASVTANYSAAIRYAKELEEETTLKGEVVDVIDLLKHESGSYEGNPNDPVWVNALWPEEQAAYVEYGSSVASGEPKYDIIKKITARHALAEYLTKTELFKDESMERCVKADGTTEATMSISVNDPDAPSRVELDRIKTFLSGYEGVLLDETIILTIPLIIRDDSSSKWLETSLKVTLLRSDSFDTSEGVTAYSYHCAQSGISYQTFAIKQ